MRCYIFPAVRLFSAVILILVGVVTEVTAQEISVGTEPAITEQTTCGPSVKLPSGSDFIQLKDVLQVTLPYGYTYGGTDANGTPFFAPTNQDLFHVLGPPDGHTNTLGIMRERVFIDCTCDSSDVSGTCTENYNFRTHRAWCSTEDCCAADCTVDYCRRVVVRVRVGGGDDDE